MEPAKEFEITVRRPTVAEHQMLWQAAGWGTVDSRMAEASLARSVHAVVAEAEGRVVGMGRIVGDGAMYFYIQDVAVLPGYRERGVGRAIVERLLAYIRANRYEQGLAFVGLFASPGKEGFYERFGFRDHSPGMTGMFLVMEDSAPAREDRETGGSGEENSEGRERP
ncbi:GNAT superfamily N-acetyltransferase [Paenibacillus mucilaginosus]|uniref:GNAT family N-acetyltransferase n=1 Tax=Paenibacillus mucilaginosus TaxID=61624 RepID=UPI003D1F726F